MGVPGRGAAKRVVLESLGWLLLIAGLAMIALPGPGLLGIFAGLALLSQSYTWAERATEPVKLRALKGAAESVETWPRIAGSVLGICFLVACGVLWIVNPPAPSWWTLPESWWLVGGLGTGIIQIASAFIALALMVYSYRRYHGRPEAVSDLAGQIEASDAARRTRREQRRDKLVG
jgi:hypothetical protein